MADVKHTPGPWEIFRPDDSGFLGIDGNGGKDSVVIYDDYGGIKSEADARLIAAAPDLLAACEAALLNEGGWAEWQEQVRAAIAKATGEA